MYKRMHRAVIFAIAQLSWAELKKAGVLLGGGGVVTRVDVTVAQCSCL